MEPLRSLLAISLLLNAALAAGLVHFQQPAVSTSPAASAQASAPTMAIFVTNRFHCRELETTNYEVFVANLRSVGTTWS